jgi:AraC-like DNA-binding protein
MLKKYQETQTGAYLSLVQHEPRISRYSFKQTDLVVYSIGWNRGEACTAVVDGEPIQLPANSYFTFNIKHSFDIDPAGDIVLWQFNREFYCIVEHDREVSCSGLLFYGWRQNQPITLNESETRSFELLTAVFLEEFACVDNIQGEMLRMLLKRLIIKLTRLYKIQTKDDRLLTHELDLVRQFNFLVEIHFRQLHQVQDYARLLYKSPKTLSNLFGKHHVKSPSEIIAERIYIESKRIILYSDTPIKEIGYSLGFSEPAHFTRFFKKMSSGIAPTEFKKQTTD